MPIQVKVHPLGEILSRKLFGIETVPKAEQTKMVRRAIKAAMKFYDEQLPKSITKDGKEVKTGDTVWVMGSLKSHTATVIEPVTSYTLHNNIKVSESFSTRKALKEFYGE